MGLLRTSLLVVLSCAVMSVQAAKLNAKLESFTAHKSLSELEKILKNSSLKILMYTSLPFNTVVAVVMIVGTIV
jgi:hypothetical protein